MSALLWVVLLAALVVLYLVYRYLRAQFWVLASGDPSSPANPFKKYARGRKDLPIELDQKKRDKVIKRSFSLDSVPSSLDAIVIGSGIGGLSVAAILAKAGKKVLVLEQHDQAGGCCHTFIDKGFEFDVGIHYIGEMAEGTLCRVLVDQLCDSGIEWRECDTVYDTVILGMGGDNLREYPIPAGRGKLVESLVNKFPQEDEAIRKFFAILKRLRRSTLTMALLKMLPRWCSNLLISSGLVAWTNPDMAYYQTSLTQVLDDMFTDEELKAVLSYSFGDYGTIPKDASFGMQAALTNHFTYGGYYPIGGASEIAFNIIPTIEAAGGRVLVRAKVSRILMDEDKAVGVTVKQGHTAYDILAPLIISDAGLYNTVECLLPPSVSGLDTSVAGLDSTLAHVRHGVGLMSVFIGLDGSPEELGLRAGHVWGFRGADLNTITQEYVDTPLEDIATAKVPLMFLSFPSTKDPTYSQRFPGKSTVAIVTIAPYEWFKEWENERVQRRGDDYVGVKSALANQMWEQAVELFPKLEGRKVYMDVGTPLSNIHYLGTPRGEVYGVDHNTTRFSLQAMSDLRPQTSVPGLYLTGQDVFMCGFIGAMFGGVLCASAILRRNLTGDLTSLSRDVKREVAKNKKE